MIPYTKKRLFACWNNRCIIVSACGDYSLSQIVYAVRRQFNSNHFVDANKLVKQDSPHYHFVDINKMIISRLRLFLMESLCQRSLFCSSARSVVCSGAALSVHIVDVSCTYGAFHAAEPRCLVMLFARGRVVGVNSFYLFLSNDNFDFCFLVYLVSSFPLNLQKVLVAGNTA